MQIVHTPGGDVVAVMKAKEAVLAEAALMHYVGENPDSNLAIGMMRKFVAANDEAERQAGDAAAAAEAEPAA